MEGERLRGVGEAAHLGVALEHVLAGGEIPGHGELAGGERELARLGERGPTSVCAAAAAAAAALVEGEHGGDAPIVGGRRIAAERTRERGRLAVAVDERLVEDGEGGRVELGSVVHVEALRARRVHVAAGGAHLRREAAARVATQQEAELRLVLGLVGRRQLGHLAHQVALELGVELALGKGARARLAHSQHGELVAHNLLQHVGRDARRQRRRRRVIERQLGGGGRLVGALLASLVRRDAHSSGWEVAAAVVAVTALDHYGAARDAHGRVGEHGELVRRVLTGADRCRAGSRAVELEWQKGGHMVVQAEQLVVERGHRGDSIGANRVQVEVDHVESIAPALGRHAHETRRLVARLVVELVEERVHAARTVHKLPRGRAIGQQSHQLQCAVHRL